MIAADGLSSSTTRIFLAPVGMFDVDYGGRRHYNPQDARETPKFSLGVTRVVKGFAWRNTTGEPEMAVHRHDLIPMKMGTQNRVTEAFTWMALARSRRLIASGPRFCVG